jgi:transposase
MSEDLFARLSRRYLALDIHKYYSIVAGVNFEGKVVLEPVRVEHADLEAWLEKHIQATDYVVIESTANAWYIYDLLEPLAEKVLVANPIKVKQIAQARVKTDIRDTLILARLLAANMIPAIWVPPVEVRNLRYLFSQRRHLNHPKGKRSNEKNTGWQHDDELSETEKFQLEFDMSTEQHLDEQAGKIAEKLARMSHEKPWAESMLYLMQLPGFGVITGMTILAAIGDITRFGDFKKLSSYSGLTPGVEQSGTKNRGKGTLAPHASAGVTKEGRKDLRWAMVEVAQRAVKSDPLWQRRFNKLCHRMRLGIGHDLERIALNPKYPRKLASEAELLALRPELAQTE